MIFFRAVNLDDILGGDKMKEVLVGVMVVIETEWWWSEGEVKKVIRGNKNVTKSWSIMYHAPSFRFYWHK